MGNMIRHLPEIEINEEWMSKTEVKREVKENREKNFQQVFFSPLFLMFIAWYVIESHV